MTVYNKLKLAILTVLASQSIHAITLEPIKVMSAPGDLLYAEMNFSQADMSSNIEVSLATSEDLNHLGISQQKPIPLNFYTRRNGQGSGVIVITSSRPYTQPELDVVLKIQEGNGTRLQHIKQPIQSKAAKPTSSNAQLLTPQVIVSEKDIALNLPESTQYNSVSNTAITAPDLRSAPVTGTSANMGAINTTGSSTNLTIHETIRSGQAAQAPQAVATPPVVSTPAPVVAQQTMHSQSIAPPVKTSNSKAQPPSKSAPAKKTKKTKAKDEQHVVKRNESLWKIASRIAAQTGQPITQVMQQIKSQNSHAFIDGDINRLRQGVALNLSNAIHQTGRKYTPSKATALSTQKAGRTKYRLNDAEMSLVADNEADAKHGTSKHAVQQAQTGAELSLKVMSAREKTLKLQQNVTEMELALKQKDYKIQLLNARMAQLQQQLKEQEKAKKPAH